MLSYEIYDTCIYVVCSKSIANFEFRIFDCRFFCGVMLVLTSLTYAYKFGQFQYSVNF